MTTSLSEEDVLSVCLAHFFSFFSISGSNTVQQRTRIAGSSMTLQTNKEWKALSPLGPYYGKTWYIKREGEGAFDPVINQTPAQAAAARLMPKPPNLETYVAALSRVEDGRDFHTRIRSIHANGHSESQLDRDYD
jgi:hypothetical protein